MRLKRNKSTDDGTQVTVRHGDHHDVANVDRDFGFGSVVASESRQRLLNRDGTFNVRRTGLSFWQSLSLYHLLLNISWTRFLCLLATAYVAINIFFGFLYSLCGAAALEGPDGT